MNGQHQWEVPITSLAVVGISFRLPGGANNPEKLWEILSEGTDTWSPVPDDRFNERAFYHPSPDDPNGTTNHRGGHFIEANLRSFDTTFFRIAPQQAAYMDPQQRMLLELTYEALENAGLPREQYSGSNTGVFGALFITDFDRNVLKDTIGKSPYALLGQEEAMIANRISHSLDLQGPSLTLDTGCSGGMVALHQACSALRNGECETAVVASANLTLSPDHAAEMSSLHFLGGDGRCYPFDSRGSGYGRGEGHVVFVLKRLQDALDGRYPVRAIIRSTAVNQDGYTPGGITHPNRKAQEDIIRFAYSRAGLQPYDISYIEAHGTGTVAGDSEEMAAISSVFTGPGRSSPLYVGSIKGNIGHTENTSGLAGVLKSILVLDHEQIPPLTNFEIPKPGLPLDGMCLPRTLQPLPRVPGIPLRVSVNSFGYGGTNGHAILEEAPDKNTLRPPDDSPLGRSLPLLFQLSANCKESLLSLMEKYASWLGNHLQASLIDLSYTLRERRSALPWRFSCVAETHGELAQQLNDGLNGGKIQTMSSNGGTVVYVFTGQGAQWLGMGRELLKTNGSASTIFQKSIQASTEILLQLGATWNLETALLGTGPESDLLNTAELAQPVTTALQSQGVKPDVVVGHSSGEVAAAYAAGYISHQVALTIAFHRGFMAQAAKQIDLPAGGMMSVGLGEEEAAKIIKSLSKGKVVIACINSPSNVTISGDALALDELSQILDDNGDGIFRRRLFVDTAYHSHHMLAVTENYRARLGTLGHMKPTSTGNQPRFVSSVTGATKSSDFGAEYWIDNLVSPVRFRDAIQTVATDLGFHRTSQRSPSVFFIEVGPHPALAGPVRHSLAEVGGGVPEFTYGSVLQRKMGAVTSALSLIGRLFEKGFHVERTAVSDLVSEFATARVSTDLPSYAWDHSVEYWKEPRHSSEHRFRRHPYHDLLGVHIPGSVSTEPQWRHSVSIETLPWVADHVIDGLIIFPGSGYICMALEGIRQLQKDRYPSQTLEFLVVRDISFIRALVIPPTGQVELQLRLKPRATLGLDFSFSIAALSDGEWSENCTGCVEGLLIDELSSHREETTQAGQPELPNGQLVEVSQLYEGLRACGNTYGPSFAAIQSYNLSADAQQSMAAVMIPNVAATMRAQYQEPHLIHPTTLDAILHASLPVAQQSLGPGSIMPVHIDEFLVSAAPNLPTQPGSELQVDTKMLSSHLRTAHLDLVVTTKASNSPVLAISGVELRKVGDGPEVNHDSRAAEEPETCYQVEWEADQDFLRLEDMEESPSLEQLLGYISFKTPGLTILDIEPSKRPAEFSTLDVIEGHRGSVDLYDMFEHKPLPNGHLNNGHTNGGPWQIEDIRPSLHSPSYDVILITSLEWIEAASSILKPNGILISVISPIDEMTAVSSPYLKTQLTFEDTTLGQKIVMMRPVKASKDKNHSDEIQVICHSEEQSVSPWAKALIDALPCYQINIQGAPTTLDSEAIQNSASGTPTLVIEDQPQAILADPKYFRPATSLLRQPAQVVWVSSENDVRAHQTTGVIRTAHAENDNLRATAIYTEAEAPLEVRFHDLVAFSISKAGEKNREREYRMLKSGIVLIPRLRIHKGYTDAVRADSEEIFDVKNRSIEDLSRPVELCISSGGQKPGGAYFTEQETSSANSVAQNDVQIAVDCMAVTGSYRSSHLGEYVGTIVRVGLSVNGFVVGDRVVALGTTIGSSHPCVSQAHAVHLPDNLSSVKTSALIMSAMTAVYYLRESANLSQGDTVLVHGAGTAVGKASVTLARSIGVRVAIAVADDSEAVLFQQREAFSPDDIFIIRPSLTRRSAKEMFGNGLDAIITATEDPLPTEIPRLVKPGGSILIMASSTHNTFAATLPVELPRNTTIHHCDLRSLLEARPKMIGSLLPQAVSLLSCISLDGLDILVREVSQTQEALKLLDSHAHPIAILQVKKDYLTQVKVMKRSTWQHENGSFVISGGLGELGQRFLQLLARYGAKFLVTLSRSLLPEDKLQELESKLKAINPECRVYCIKCDITSKESVEEAAKSIKDLGLYPIRGVIQSSTIIRDGTLETMSFEDYRSSFQIKADGSLHLYRVFSSTNLQFFILLSSIVGVVGTSGQANYNAGNATQDIFSHIHGGDSCRFTSLNIGWVPDTHLVADYEVRKNSVRRAGLHPVSPQALYNFFDHTIAATATTERTSQVVIGIESKDAAQSIAVNGNVYSPLFCHVVHGATDVKKPSDGATQTFSEVVATGDFDLIVDFISRTFMAQLARLLYVDVSAIDRFLTSLLVLGVDSLVAIELRNWVQREFDASVQSSEIFTDQSVYTLSEKIATRSRAISNLEFQM